MSRYRPPSIPSSRYITAEGEQCLLKELKYLWKIKRPEVTESVREAAAQGDRSENAEYIYGKKQLREIDRRVRYLSKRLDDMTVVDRPPSDTSKVFFGAWVSLIDEQDNERRFRIVGPDEINTDNNYISIDAPMARALLKKSTGDEIEVNTPTGSHFYEITAIEYQN
ncbi:MAG: transcription elongation factor GreB [Halopseudomonas sp.]